ncbi:hypothetical protein [Inhella sp.]|uniref:hypothetical protein n=1 Tax=Inhella sp. TaxID=1921806 RepID=UPI0035B14E04
MKTTFLAGALSATLLLAADPVRAHGGDDAPPAAAGPTLPRFAASSDLFELVGVLEGKTLTLWLDRSASNEPVTQAELELELLGQKLQAKPQADGRFVAELAAAPGEGVHAITVTLSAGEDSDLLAAELDLHAHAEAPAHASGWRRFAPHALLATLAAGAAAFILQRRRTRRAAAFGDAA